MKEIFKILKKFILPIIIIIVLLYIQAMCDLSLPDYTANIVNVGIQQNGIEEKTPKVISKETLNILLKFSNNDEDREYILNSYEFVFVNNEKYEKIKKENKIESNDEFYTIKADINQSELEGKMKIPFMVVSILRSDNEISMQIKEKIAQGHGLDPNTIDIVTIVSQLDPNTLTEMKTNINKQFEVLDEIMVNQSLVTFVKAEYQRLSINLDSLQMRYVIVMGARMLGLALFVMVLTIVITFLSSRVGGKVGKLLRSKIVNKVMRFSNKEFEEFSTASLITRTTNDIQQIQMMIVMMLRMVIYSPIIGIGALTKVMGSSISWIIAVAVGTIVMIIVFLFIFAMPKFNIIQELVDKLNLVSREILTGLPVIRAFAKEKHEEDRFNEANKRLTKTNLFVNRVMTIMMPTMVLIMNVVSVMIIWFGAKEVDSGSIQLGTLMAFITYSMQIIMSFLMLSMMSIMLPRAFVSVKRVAKVLDKKESIIETSSPIIPKKENIGMVEFKNVSFAYPDASEPVLEDISFSIKKGETLAIIGPTGSGKSTLVKLILRFSDVISGEILVNNVNIKDMKLKDLRDKIGYVPQKGILFSGTIESNIAFSDENMSAETIINAAKIAQATEFIDKSQEKYESPISQGGTNVSGGQRQRLQIARAIAKEPEIYIFDDSFSALDYKTDITLRQELNKYTKEATKIIVAQRIGTVISADKIIVLDEGKIESIGKHEELLKTSKLYQEIALSQLSKEELENG